MEPNELIVCRDASLGYEGQSVLAHLDLTIRAGDYLCIVGDNGSGKSTLLRGLLGLLSPQSGMIVEPVDNVVVAIEPVKKGETVTYMCAGEEKRLTAAEDITIYHKLAACDIAKGQPIVKYGEHIGLAARDIKAGEHVHCHNLEEHRENLDSKG